jgi:MFS family permease|tara:strand:+ start:4006 stop:5223 length:1218 start_codon:yes stop_codon:yes gene_type:complete
MVFIAIAIDFFSVGFAFQSYSVIQIQIENELQLSRFMTTLTLPIFMLCSALLYPVIGKLLDSFSTRDVLCVGGLIYAFSLISLYFTNTYLSFILVFALPIALGAGLLGNLSTSKLVSNWFNQKTGRALGIAAVGVSFAGFIFPLVTQYFLMDMLGLTWREVYLAYGILLLIIITPAIWLSVIDHPEKVGQYVDGISISEEAKEEAKTEGQDWQIASLLRDKNFWILSFVFSLQFSAMFSILSHITLFAKDMGWAGQAAFIFSMYAIPAMISKVLFGWLVENKLNPKVAVSISLILQGIGIILILYSNTPYQLAFVMAIFGFGGGAALPLSNILFARIYTPRSFGRSRGLAQPLIAVFQASGAPIVALMYQAYGNYNLAFWYLTVLLLLALALVWILKFENEPVKN